MFPVREVLMILSYKSLKCLHYSRINSIHVFEVRESIADIHTEIPCFGDLENSGQLPVQEVFKLTRTFVSLTEKYSKFISSREKVVVFPHEINSN